MAQFYKRLFRCDFRFYTKKILDKFYLYITILLSGLPGRSPKRHYSEQEVRTWVVETRRGRERQRDTILSPRYDKVTHAEKSHMEQGGSMEGGIYEASLGFLSTFKGPLPPKNTSVFFTLPHSVFCTAFPLQAKRPFFCCCKQPKNVFSYRCCHLPYFVKHSRYYARWLIHFFFFWATFFFSLQTKKKEKKAAVTITPQRSVLQENMCQLYSDHHFWSAAQLSHGCMH